MDMLHVEHYLEARGRAQDCAGVHRPEGASAELASYNNVR